jgi:hypothetical protein
MPKGTTYKLKVMYPSRSSSYFLKTSVILFKLIQAWTNRSKLIAFSPLRSYVLNNNLTNPGPSLYPKLTKASWNSSNEMLPLRSASNRSNRLRHAVRKPQRPLETNQHSSSIRTKWGVEKTTHLNSSKLILLFRSASNILIIILTVCGSKGLQSPLTSALFSSSSLNCPLLSRSTL